jgi:hypothetical protein
MTVRGNMDGQGVTTKRLMFQHPILWIDTVTLYLLQSIRPKWGTTYVEQVTATVNDLVREGDMKRYAVKDRNCQTVQVCWILLCLS